MARRARPYPLGPYSNNEALAMRRKWGHPPCRTLADMSETEICALERTYGAPVIRPCLNAAPTSL